MLEVIQLKNNVVCNPVRGCGSTHLAALRAGRVVRLHVALEGVGRVEVRWVPDGGVREIGRRRRGQDSGGGKLQGRVWWGAPR